RRAWERGRGGWAIHFLAIRGAYQITDDLSTFYESAVPDAPAGEALRLVRGYADELHEVERGLDRLTAMVGADPTLRQAFEATEPPTLEALEATPEAIAFRMPLQG